VVPGAELPPGEAHDNMVSILGKLGRVLSPEELTVAARGLNEGRLPPEELAKIVEHVLEKEGDAGRYFDRRQGFLPAILADEIREAYGGGMRHLRTRLAGSALPPPPYALDAASEVNGVAVVA